MPYIWIVLSTFSAITICIQGQVVVPSVEILGQGTVVGSATANEPYFQFYGIPYADSTAGGNRFKAPTAPPKFETIFVANRKGIKCVRALGVGYEGTEDCLVLDVHTSTLNSSRHLPVMVWIQGKDLDDAAKNPDLSFKKFVEEEVVVVKINYRESILGFLCLGTEDAPGNAGLKDVIAGLRWIKRNIAAFGGDPNNVILFGHGSGASIVDLITLSPIAEDLVHKAIAQSGTALAPWAVTRNNLKYAIEVAEALGHIVSDIETLSEVLSRTSIAALMGVINELDLTDNSLAFAPCIERNIDDVEAVLLMSPYHTIIEGQQLQIPFMTGFVDNEGTLRANKAHNNDWMVRMDEDFEKFIQSDIDISSIEDEDNEVVERIKTFYFNNGLVSSSDVSDFLRYNGDTMILISAIREARMRVASSPNAPVYLYQFSYSSALTEILEKPISTETAGHKEELVYMFYNENKIEPTNYDKKIIDIIIERWTSFAKTGVPTSVTSQTTWQPFTSSNSYYLRVLDDTEINNNQNIFDVQLQNPYPDALTFWDSIYSDHFADAESRWSLIDRGDDETTTLGTTQGTTPEPTEPTTDSPGSASTAVGYTFVILTLFALLDKFHNLQILS